ncbi:MAG TPA: hypothetical protein VHR66_21060 [Gemmataceae bacterium]|jgi:hypothetical protein|nr:hypothetical protein [Gemmataceae bacterium]
MGLPAPPLANPRRRARRARSTIVCWVATLLVLNVCFGVFVHYRPGFRDPLFDAKVKALGARFAASGEPIKVVVLGSSRTAAAVEPKSLEAAVAAETGRPCVAFNMGVQGNGPVSQLVHYRRIRDAGIKPDVVVVELLPSAFAWFLDPKRHENRPYDATILRPDRLSRDELDTVCAYGFPLPETREDWWETTFNPWFGFRFQLLARLEPKWLPPGIVQHRRDIGETGGWGPWDAVSPEVKRQRVAEVKSAYGSQLHVIDLKGPHVPAIDELLNECKQDGVRVVVVVPPEGSEFRSWYPPGVQDALAAFQERLRRDHGVPVIDARTWLPDEAFVDSHHVVRTWAKPYTERLAREAIVPAVR